MLYQEDIFSAMSKGEMMTNYLCSFHIPKTGGTTFAHHARSSLGDKAFLLHGPFSRADRFLGNCPQVEEMNDEERFRIKIVHGHGAGLELAKVMTGRMPEFMVILRDPYARFVSGFNHFNNERRNNALQPVSEERYFKSRGGNFYARSLLKYFAPLAAHGREVSINNLRPILQSFKYFLLTEHMDRQLPEIAGLYGLGQGEIETRRINKSKSALSTGKEVFDRWNGVDREIYSELEAMAIRPKSIIGNPFGYNPSILKNFLEKNWAEQTPESRLAIAYRDLVDSLKKTVKLQAAHLKIVHGSTAHIKEPKILLVMIADAMDAWLSNLKDDESSLAYFWSGVMFMNEEDLRNAEKYFRESLHFNPQNDNSLAHLALTLYRLGAKAEAKDYINKALEVRPDRPHNQKIFNIVSGK